MMVREGLVLPSYQRVQYAKNLEYRKLSQDAASRGVGLWNATHCGRGPVADLSIRVTWDAIGDDAVNVNGEYMKITNHGSATVKLGGWWVRDSALRASADVVAGRRGFSFPARAQVAAGKSVYVHVGRAPSQPHPGRYFYGLTAPIFENVTRAPTHLGDGAYLFDPQGDLRSWQQYPCVSTSARGCLR